MLVVQDQTNSIIHFDILTRKEIQRTPLASLNSYDKIATYFEHKNKNKNKGLEGITVNFKMVIYLSLKRGIQASSSNSIQSARHLLIIAFLMNSMALYTTE